MNEIPRRIRVDQWCEAERAIQAAVDVVEAMPADPALTDAVVLLGQARARVADYIDPLAAKGQMPLTPGERATIDAYLARK